MNSISCIALLFLLVTAKSIEAESQSSSGPVVHEGQCPTYNLPIPIMCRRRVCLPEELVPLCAMDGDCPTTHKCCRPLCSCRDRCVEAFPA